MLAGLGQRGVGVPGRPGVDRALRQGQLGFGGRNEAQLDVVGAQPDRIQCLERHVMADRASVGGNALALEVLAALFKGESGCTRMAVP